MLFSWDKAWCQLLVIKISFSQGYSMVSSASNSLLSPILSSLCGRQLWPAPTTSWCPPSISSSGISARGCRKQNSPNAKSIFPISLLLPTYKGVLFSVCPLRGSTWKSTTTQGGSPFPLEGCLDATKLSTTV